MQCGQEIIDHTENIQSFMKDHDSCYTEVLFFFEPANFICTGLTQFTFPWIPDSVTTTVPNMNRSKYLWLDKAP